METANNLEERIGSHLGDGIIGEEIGSPSRRDFLKGLLGAGAVAVTPRLALAQRGNKRISDEARNRIWANYPEMQGAIDLINNNAFEGLIDYAMYPNQGYSDPRGVPTSVKKIPKKDMHTPHYWLLLKIQEGDGYNIFADDNGAPFLGIPPPSPLGVRHFARGLRTGSSDNESDLLKALYIGATGSPQGAEPIINGTFMNVSGVREKVRKWRDEYNFAPYSDEGNHLLAYNSNVLRNTNFRDNELVELSLLALGDFYDGINSPEKDAIYSGNIIEVLDRREKLAGYSIITRDGSAWVVEDPSPRLRF